MEQDGAAGALTAAGLAAVTPVCACHAWLDVCVSSRLVGPPCAGVAASPAGGDIDRVFDVAGRDLAGASIAAVDSLPLSRVLQAAQLAHQLSEEAAIEDCRALPTKDDLDVVAMPVDGNQRSEGSPLSDEVVAWVDMDAAGGTGGTASAGAELLVAGRRRLAQAKSSADSGSGSPQPMNDDTRRGRREVDLDGAGAEGIFNAGSAEVRSGIEIGYKHQRPPLWRSCVSTPTRQRARGCVPSWQRGPSLPIARADVTSTRTSRTSQLHSSRARTRLSRRGGLAGALPFALPTSCVALSAATPRRRPRHRESSTTASAAHFAA